MKRMRWMRVHGFLLALLVAVMAFGGCASDPDEGAPKGKTISGRVTDLNQFPLEGVHVSAYGGSATSDANGEFSFSADVPSDRVVIDFQKEGYFDHTIGKQPSPNGSTNVKVALILRELAGTVDNASGGQVATAEIHGDFVANSFARADGSPLDGNVDIFAGYLDPDDSGFGNAMPGGDFSAKDAQGGDGLLTSFGALAIEAEEESSGEAALLRESADLCVAIPASMLAAAPDTMPVWLLNGGGVWEEAATAQRVGDEYCFSVTMLGRINCDIFSRSALVTGDVCDGDKPAGDTEVRIGQLSTQTDDAGVYSVLVQADAELTLETEFGSVTAGPFAAASTNTVNIGCGAGGDPCGAIGTWQVSGSGGNVCGSCEPILPFAYTFTIDASIAGSGGVPADLPAAIFNSSTCQVTIDPGYVDACGPFTDVYDLKSGPSHIEVHCNDGSCCTTELPATVAKL